MIRSKFLWVNIQEIINSVVSIKYAVLLLLLLQIMSEMVRNQCDMWF